MTPWDSATLALNLLAIDPHGLGGMTVRARVSPARDALMAVADTLPGASHRLHPNMTSQALDGDIDLSATLGGGTLVMQKGLLQRGPSVLVLPMAERTEPYLAARLCQVLDHAQGHLVLALDEGADDDAKPPASLTDRLAFQAALDGLTLSEIGLATLPDNLTDRRDVARNITIPADVLEQLVVLGVNLGITSLRAPSFAARAAQAHAAMCGRDCLHADDVTVAVALVFAHRATRLPEIGEPEEEQPPPDSPPEDTSRSEDMSIPDDMLLEAVKTALPSDILSRLETGTAKGGSGAGSGKKRTGNRRGRPLPARTGTRSTSARVDLIATLRAAIPWQTLRKKAHPGRKGAIIRPADLRHKRYQSLSDRLLIFTVDASGSAALARLAEAKGAVEILLSEAYARRDHVALISFRGTQADVLLPPTRSLVQTKRRLAELPGGGGTPLASGLSAAMTMAEATAHKGLTPTIVLLTDGRGNVALDGQPNRVQAALDAQTVASALAANSTDAIVIDTTIRPDTSLRSLADTMRATYITLPRADAGRLSKAVNASLVD